MYRRHFAIVMTFGALALLILALGRPAIAIGPTVKWVDQAGGSDANDGDSEATAYATLQHAIDNSESGLDAGNRSFIYVRDGAYGSAGISHTCDGQLTAVLIEDLDWLTIQAAPGHEPYVRPDTIIEANIVSIVVENSDHLVLDNIDSDQTVAKFDNVHVCNSDDFTLRNSRYEGGEDGIDFHTALTAALIEDNEFVDIVHGSGDEVLDFTDEFDYAGVVIQDNTFTNNYRQITINPLAPGSAANFTIRRNLMNGTSSQEAVRLIGASDILLENNVILNSQQEGVYVDSGCSNITIQHNTFFNNSLEAPGTGYGEIRTKITSADIVIKNNILNGNGANPPIDTTVASLPGEDYNLAYNYTLAGSFTTFGTNTITGMDPLFVNTTPGSEDLHLTAGSPAVEQGDDLGVTDDKDKGVRPNPAATSPDMGAYEYFDPVPPSACPAEHEDVGYEMSNIVGNGMSDDRRMRIASRIFIPDYQDLTALYGQLAGKGPEYAVRYVRFFYPKGPQPAKIFIQESPAYLPGAIHWYGMELDPDRLDVTGGLKGNMRARWYLTGTGRRLKTPRASIYYPTYETDELYANVLALFDDSSTNHAAHETGYNSTATQVVTIPETQSMIDIRVQVAIVDVMNDDRPVMLRIEAVGATPFEATLLTPTDGPSLNIIEVVLADVPAGTDEITIMLSSPAPDLLYPDGGDSAAMVGATISYACESPAP